MRKIIELDGTLEKPSLSGTFGDRVELTAGVNASAAVATDYEGLAKKPQINSVELVGNKTPKDLRIISEGTEEYWTEHASYVPLKGEIIVYSDYDSKDGVAVAGIKVGDGEAYVVDLPFIDSTVRSTLNNHIADNTRHITALERFRWNEKLNYSLDDETLILSQGG